VKFATKLIGIFSGIFLVSTLSVTYFVYTSNIRILEKEIKEKLEAQAFHTMDKIDRMLFERYEDMVTLSLDPVISSRGHTAKQVSERLKEYQHNYRFYASLSFFDLNRVRIADTSGKSIGKRRELVEYWRDIDAGKEFVVNIHKSVTLNTVVIHFVHIVKDRNGIPFGVVVSRMPVEKLYDITRFVPVVSHDSEVQKHLEIDLVDKDGLLLYSNRNRAILQDLSPHWNFVKAALAIGENVGNLKHAPARPEVITTFVRERGYLDFRGNDWTLIMVVPASLAFLPADEMRNNIIGISSFFGILSLLIIFLFSRTISGPILKLSEASVEIGKGNLDSKVEIASRDEIGQMAGAFNTMASQIKEYITTQNRSEEALRRSEAKAKALFNAIPDMIFRISREGFFLEYETEHNRSTLVPPSEFIGASIREIMPSDVAEKTLHHIDRALQDGELQSFEYKLYLNGTHRHYEARIVKSGEDEVLAIVRDITEHRRLEEQLFHAQKMEAIGTMAGGIAHEYNNILTAIMGFGEILRDNLDSDNPLRGYADLLLSSSERAAKITKGLLAYTRKQVTLMDYADVNEIIKTMESFLPSLVGEKIRLSIETAATGLPVLADRAQIEQVLMNLVTNAVDAMPGGGDLTITAAPFRGEKGFADNQACLPPGNYALVTVADTGIGIDRETQAKMFEPFFTTKEVGKGTGLGLSIVYGVVQKHRGYITVESAAGRGTSFRIYLPLLESEGNKAQAVPPAQPAGGTETVLVAEDNVSVRNLVSQVLENAGYRVIEAVDGMDAVQKFIEHEDSINLLLFDISMPHMTGTTAYHEIEKNKKDIKVIFLSGYAYDDDSMKEIADKGYPFIQKPLTPKELLKKLREVLD